MVRLYFRVPRIVLAGLVVAAVLTAENVPVRHSEGVVRGFLVLRRSGGAVIANGDLVQFANGERVTSRLTFRFRDGSLQEETTVFSQRRGPVLPGRPGLEDRARGARIPSGRGGPLKR
jgi:hypothetical protein